MSDPRVGVQIPEIRVVLDEARNGYYLDATHETQAVFLDEAVATARGLPGLPTPPTRLFGPTMPGFPDPVSLMGLSFEKALMGGASYEFSRLPSVGESFTLQGRIADVSTRDTKTGVMTFVVLVVEYVDETGDIVVTERLTFIERP